MPSAWYTLAAHHWYTLADYTWYTLGEHRWYIIARSMTLALERLLDGLPVHQFQATVWLVARRMEDL
jgi:hypothetical protein